MTSIDTSTGSFSSGIQGALGKSQRTWAAFQKLHENDPPKFELLDTKKPIEFAPNIPDTNPNIDLHPVKFEELDAGIPWSQEDTKEDAVQRAREAAEKLVSSTLITPILKQVRESNNAPAPFGPTKAEKQFGSLMDAKMADDIVKAAQFPLVQRIQQDLLKHSSYMSDATKAINDRSAIVNNNPVDLVG